MVHLDLKHLGDGAIRTPRMTCRISNTFTECALNRRKGSMAVLILAKRASPPDEGPTSPLEQGHKQEDRCDRSELSTWQDKQVTEGESPPKLLQKLLLGEIVGC